MPDQAAAGRSEARESTRKFLTGAARALGGAIIFSLPVLMTMEMWWLGFYMDRARLVLLTLLMLPLLVGLSRYSGFRSTTLWLDDVLDALVAYGIALFASAAVLSLFNVLQPGMSLDEIVGKITLQAVPAGFGAMLANSQLSGASEDQEAGESEKRESGYGGELLIMLAGALFLAFNVAPTEEMMLIAFKMTEWHAVVLVLVTLGLMHAFVYAVDFSGQEQIPEGTSLWSLFMRFTAVGYVLSLVVSAYVLWTFGRFEDPSLSMCVMITVVLGFPASIGAASARLIL